MSERKRYLGDGIYVDVANRYGDVILTAEVGEQGPVALILGPEVMVELARWWAEIRAKEGKVPHD